ncbi:hypothetical protein [Duganella vulcania]|uniref:MarR family transcriptional regulator n=1 Tax=Duganella vulcania TaxID=2692166 RepID=A0A845GGM8_9BURK|nr:hypothetical protein [Duganella vulcania]MYM92572.1 hypothetical protein [Duganella vulcania]
MTSTRNKPLAKPQRTLLTSLRANAQADCFSTPLAVSIELDVNEVPVARRLADKGMLRISETDDRQVYLTAAGLAH